MHNDEDKIRTAAANGLNKAETEALIGRAMAAQDLKLFNKTKAAMKLQAAADKKKSEQEKLKPPAAGITNTL